MGRGRQKAKHTKIARDLKYFSPDTNYGALERELIGKGKTEPSDNWPEYDDSADKYDELADKYNDYDDEDEEDEEYSR